VHIFCGNVFIVQCRNYTLFCRHLAAVSGPFNGIKVGHVFVCLEWPYSDLISSRISSIVRSTSMQRTFL